MDILREIVAVKKEEVAKLRSEFRYRHFTDSEYFEQHVKSMKRAVDTDNYIAIIAEIKKASPSAGIIRKDFDHLQLAEVYQENGVSAISVLTDQQFFQGHISFLNDIAERSEVSVLRKDFIIDEYQIFEAKANGADCVLLISEILSQSQLAELTHAARETGIEILLELHSSSQLSKINFTENNLIGINNRNLADFSVDLQTTLNICELIPPEISIVSESGIKSESHLDQLKKSRINGVLVGEHFMRAPDVSSEVKKFKTWCCNAS